MDNSELFRIARDNYLKNSEARIDRFKIGSDIESKRFYMVDRSNHESEMYRLQFSIKMNKFREIEDEYLRRFIASMREEFRI